MITRYMKFADLFTILNGASGLLSMWFSLEGKFSISSIFLILAFAFDSLDGFVARYMGGGNDFGRELDSLADALSFSAAPFVFGISISRQLPVLASGIVFSICGILRLARFNITHLDYFEGVPITTNGILFPLLWFFLKNEVSLVLPIAYLIMAVLMVSSFKVKKMRFG